MTINNNGKTVVASAPLRVDLTGGFTDIPPFSWRERCVHINAALDLKVDVECRSKLGVGVSVITALTRVGGGAKLEKTNARFEEALRYACEPILGKNGVELSINTDAPGGTGLGSSGAIVVAAICGSAWIAGSMLARDEIAAIAIRAAARAGILGGRQDEFAAAFGSLNVYTFETDERYEISPLIMHPVRKHIESTMLLVQTEAEGRKRDIVADVGDAARAERAETLNALYRLNGLAQAMKEVLFQNQVEKLAGIIREIREAQLSLHPEMLCPRVREAMARVMEKFPGTEYKLCGGGGAGSCILVQAPHGLRDNIAASLSHSMKRVLKVRIGSGGVRARARSHR